MAQYFVIHSGLSNIPERLSYPSDDLEKLSYTVVVYRGQRGYYIPHITQLMLEHKRKGWLSITPDPDAALDTEEEVQIIVAQAQQASDDATQALSLAQSASTQASQVASDLADLEAGLGNMISTQVSSEIAAIPIADQTQNGLMSATDKSKLDGIAAGATAYTDEMAQDAVGALLTDSSTIDFTYNDPPNTLTADVKDSSISFAKMQNIATQKLLGRHATGTGAIQEITLGDGLSLDANTGVLSATPPASTGEANTASNLGTGEGVYAQKSGVDLQFKSIKAGASGAHKITSSATEITIENVFNSNPRNATVTFFEDFILRSLTATSWLTQVRSGTGASITAVTPTFGGTDQRLGVVRLTTGTTNTGTVGMYAGSSAATFNLGNLPTNKETEFAVEITPNQVSTSTERFILYAGIGDQAAASESADGVYFRYTDNVNGGRWECVVASNFVRTAVDSGVTLVAGTSYRLRVVVRNVAGVITATFYINGTQVHQTTTGLPTDSGRDVSVCTFITKTVGTTDVTVDLDYIWWKYETGRSVSL